MGRTPHLSHGQGRHQQVRLGRPGGELASLGAIILAVLICDGVIEESGWAWVARSVSGACSGGLTCFVCVQVETVDMGFGGVCEYFCHADEQQASSRRITASAR